MAVYKEDREARIVCDTPNCGRSHWVTGHYTHAKMVRATVRDDGWAYRRVDGWFGNVWVDLCPECAKEVV